MRGLVDLKKKRKKTSLCVQQDSSCSSEAVELVQSLTLVVDAALTSDGYQSEYSPSLYSPSLLWTQCSPVVNTKVSTIPLCTIPLSCERSTHQWWIPKWVQSHFVQSLSLVNAVLTSDKYQSEHNPTLYSPSLLWQTQCSPVRDTIVSTIPVFTGPLSCSGCSAHQWWPPKWVQS